jgi:hypothetical protein
MDNKTVSEIKEYCRDNHITGYSKFTKKQELMDFVNNQDVPNQQIVSDAEFAAALLNSEREFYMKKQYEEIKKQKLQYEKERETFLENKKQENKIIQETRVSQDHEYEKALQQDLENNVVEDVLEEVIEEVVEEVKTNYSEKISGDELEKMRMARLSRFG